MRRNNIIMTTMEKVIRKILRRHIRAVSARINRKTRVIYSRECVFGSCLLTLVYHFVSKHGFNRLG